MVVFDGMKLLDVAGPAEVFAESNRFGADYRLSFASVDGAEVTTSVGSRFAVTRRIDEIASADTVLVAGGDNLVGRPIDPALIEAVRGARARTRRMASICTGAFILAQAGVLSGRTATTHWRHVRLLAAAFPDIRVQLDAIFIRDGEIYTSAGVTAGIDLALALVEADYGAELVRTVARSLVVYLKRAGGQSQFSALVEADPPADSALRTIVTAIATDPSADHSVKNPCRTGLHEHAATHPAVQRGAGDDTGPLCRDGTDRQRARRPGRRPQRHGGRPYRRFRQRGDNAKGVRATPRGEPARLPGQVSHRRTGLSGPTVP